MRRGIGTSESASTGTKPPESHLFDRDLIVTGAGCGLEFLKQVLFPGASRLASVEKGYRSLDGRYPGFRGVSDEPVGEKIRRVGADRVISPYVIGGV